MAEGFIRLAVLYSGYVLLFCMGYRAGKLL